GALVCVTSVEDGKVRARYRIARTRDEVLAARGSTYVLGEFSREAMSLIKEFDGKLAVVGLPCEIRLVRQNASLADKVVVTIALFCGHTTETEFLDKLTDKLSQNAGGSKIVGFRFRKGHWRGRLSAQFADGTSVERPSAYYLLYHNLYYGTPKKCMFCGDHFGYSADISAGDLWSQKYKNDPIKHTALMIKTERGARALEIARAAGNLAAEPVRVSDILDGQRRTAPFHYNVTARAQAGERLGMRVPDKVNTSVRWHERSVARATLKNHLETRTDEGSAKVLGRNRRLLKLKLYWMKGLESLPTGPLVSRPAKDARRFSLIAATVSGNRGAEAMLDTSIGRIRDRYPDAHFSLFSYYPEKDRALIRDPRVTVHSSTPAYLVGVLFPMSLLAAPFARLGGSVPGMFPRSVRDLASSSALVDLAGVSFIDGREKFLPFNILTILPAMLLKTPVFKLAQALGPFKHPLNRMSARLLKRCALVVPRGDVTLSHMEQIAFPAERMYPAPDVAFLFEERDSLSVEGDAEASELAEKAAALRAAGHAVVGLCPSAVIAGKAGEEGWDYIGFMAELTQGLLADGHAVLLFPNATRAGSAKLRNNDLPVIAQIAERVGDNERVLAVAGDMNAAALRTVLKACSAAAVSRFHAMVGALSEGVPVAVVGWSHKYLEVMKQFGLGEF
ncbi:MAG TPA: Coenzyme F420 hydrogenase/dehydrogenase, beta subunit C-terminal domain, partial [Coriobacteriia bacterium]|nr:Coenzyme F420 hydrogenase/dehydrogenase, beta subunit C-terminal domain [Coriobacteriia bacterium]